MNQTTGTFVFVSMKENSSLAVNEVQLLKKSAKNRFEI